MAVTAEIKGLREECSKRGIKYHQRHNCTSLTKLIGAHDREPTNKMPADIANILKRMRRLNMDYAKRLRQYIEGLLTNAG